MMVVTIDAIVASRASRSAGLGLDLREGLPNGRLPHFVELMEGDRGVLSDQHHNMTITIS